MIKVKGVFFLESVKNKKHTNYLIQLRIESLLAEMLFLKKENARTRRKLKT